MGTKKTTGEQGRAWTSQRFREQNKEEVTVFKECLVSSAE